MYWIVGCMTICGLGFALAGEEQASVLQKIRWQKGPCTGQLERVAHVWVPEGYIFADAKDTRTLMEAMQNPVSGTEKGFLSPMDLKWFLVFEFEDVGYVKDDEKNTLDADAMLKSIQAGNEITNKERKKRGWTTLTITGWEQPPRYDPDTHNLEWAIRCESGGQQVINYNVRLLGRGGVMKVTFVGDPSELAQAMPKYRSLVKGFDFSTGQRYAEYRQGDKLAKYGLAALVVGGAAAAAVQTGLLQKLLKPIIIGLIALGALLKKFWGKLFGRKESAEPPKT